MSFTFLVTKGFAFYNNFLYITLHNSAVTPCYCSMLGILSAYTIRACSLHSTLQNGFAVHNQCLSFWTQSELVIYIQPFDVYNQSLSFTFLVTKWVNCMQPERAIYIPRYKNGFAVCNRSLSLTFLVTKWVCCMQQERVIYIPRYKMGLLYATGACHLHSTLQNGFAVCNRSVSLTFLVTKWVCCKQRRRRSEPAARGDWKWTYPYRKTSRAKAERFSRS